MKRISLVCSLAAILLLGGAGCARTSKGPQLTEKYSGPIYNYTLKKETTVTFQYPKAFSVEKRVSSDEKVSAYIIRGPESRVEILTSAYYDGLPAPVANPTPEQQKVYDIQLPKTQVSVGAAGDFWEYGFYADSNTEAKMEVEKIFGSISFADVSSVK